MQNCTTELRAACACQRWNAQSAEPGRRPALSKCARTEPRRPAAPRRHTQPHPRVRALGAMPSYLPGRSGRGRTPRLLALRLAAAWAASALLLAATGAPSAARADQGVPLARNTWPRAAGPETGHEPGSAGAARQASRPDAPLQREGDPTAAMGAEAGGIRSGDDACSSARRLRSNLR